MTPPAVTVPLTVSAKLAVLKVAVLPGPRVASQLLPVTPVQFVDETSQVPPVASPDQVPFCAPRGDENTNAKLMKAGNAFRMVLILLFMGFFDGLMMVVGLFVACAHANRWRRADMHQVGLDSGVKKVDRACVIRYVF
jgi:hypothetical protein